MSSVDDVKMKDLTLKDLIKLEKPNLLLVGCQKCGTTWMHHALTKTDQIFGSKPISLSRTTLC